MTLSPARPAHVRKPRSTSRTSTTAGTLEFLLLAASCLIVSSCSHDEAKHESAAVSLPAKLPAKSKRAASTADQPRCLNIQDGDWHIEFDGKRLLLADTPSRPAALALAGDETVTCEKLELKANGAVAIDFRTANGALKHGLASVHSAKWISEP